MEDKQSRLTVCNPPGGALVACSTMGRVESYGAVRKRSKALCTTTTLMHGSGDSQAAAP